MKYQNILHTAAIAYAFISGAEAADSIYFEYDDSTIPETPEARDRWYIFYANEVVEATVFFDQNTP